MKSSLSLLLPLFAATNGVHAGITVLGQLPLGQQTTAGETAATTRTENLPLATYAAFDDTIIAAPGLPDPMPNLEYTLELAGNGDNFVGNVIGAEVKGSFWGFSMELSILNQVIGKNSTFIPPPFLNLASIIVERAGDLHIRCGGNTQEHAVVVEDDQIANYSTFDKQRDDNSQATTETPHVVFRKDFFTMLSSISSFVPGVKWYLGIPFNTTDPFRLDIVKYGEEIVGDNLLGFQAANEPDFYHGNGLRGPEYNQQNYHDEFGQLIQQMEADAEIGIKNNLIAPSVAGTDGITNWTPESVFDTGFLDDYGQHLSVLAVEHYPDNNCKAKFQNDFSVDLTAKFPDYLNHTSPQIVTGSFANTANIARGLGKEMIMFETNTASCGGFAGISDSYGAALWTLDYGLQMAYSNFSHALLHVGGRNDHYNPFTAPPTNESDYNQWTIGAVYYSAMVMAEITGKTGTSRVVDLQGNDNNMFTPQYAIYDSESGSLQLKKVVLFNYMTDPNGNSGTTVTIRLTDGTQVPGRIAVKYLSSASVSNRDDIAWAGQSFGTKYQVDGTLRGGLNVTTVDCNTQDNSCNVYVPAPGLAVVYLDGNAESEATSTYGASTYETTTYTKTRNYATVDPSVLATSNGHSGSDREVLGATSPDSSGAEAAIVVGAMGAVALLAGCLMPFLR